MPVRSLTQSVLRWPRPEVVLAAATAWAQQQRRRYPSLMAVGVYGSYGRGDAGVGSDLDLLLLDQAAAGPEFGPALAQKVADQAKMVGQMVARLELREIPPRSDNGQRRENGGPW